MGALNGSLNTQLRNGQAETPAVKHAPPAAVTIIYGDTLERKRLLLEKVHYVISSEYIDMLENFVQLLYEKVRPYEK